MLKILPLVILAQLVPAAAERSLCTEYVLWKGSDDGLTNRVFDQVSIFNKGRKSCTKGLNCKKLNLLIPSHATLTEGDHKARFDVEIYKDLSDRSSPVQKFLVECDLAKWNCGEKVFEKIQ
jgi:hypothetical protein